MIRVTMQLQDIPVPKDAPERKSLGSEFGCCLWMFAVPIRLWIPAFAGMTELLRRNDVSFSGMMDLLEWQLQSGRVTKWQIPQ